METCHGKRKNHYLSKTADGQIDIDVTVKQETLWLNQSQLADLFQTDRTSITKHIRKIYKSQELDEGATSAIFAQFQNEGGRKITYKITQYILAVAKSKHNEKEVMTQIVGNLIKGYNS